MVKDLKITNSRRLFIFYCKPNFDKKTHFLNIFGFFVVPFFNFQNQIWITKSNVIKIKLGTHNILWFIWKNLIWFNIRLCKDIFLYVASTSFVLLDVILCLQFRCSNVHILQSRHHVISLSHCYFTRSNLKKMGPL